MTTSGPGSKLTGRKKILNTEQVSDEGASLVAQLVKNPPAMRETWV